MVKKNKTTKTINAAVIGASGYTGIELIRLLISHPYVNIKYLVADSNADKSINDLYSHLRTVNLPKLVSLDKVNFKNCDVVFCCLPHTKSQEVVKKIPSQVKVIDLSADFRLEDTKEYQEWYGHKHIAEKLQKEAVYGLSELYRKEIKAAKLVACPGCYPTSILLPLAPLCKAKLIDVSDIIIDSKSGVTGAGRSLKVASLFCEVTDNFKAYAVCNHRHIPEIEQTLTKEAGKKVTINFTPHLVPMNRGILSTIYLTLNKKTKYEDIVTYLKKFYEKENFVKILADGILPTTKDVTGSNYCNIAVIRARTPGKIVIVSVIDNLIKGASGQAVQNMNIMFGFDETTALEALPVFP